MSPGGAAKLVLGEGPGRVGEVDVLAGDRRRHRDGGMIERRGKLGEIGTERGGEGRVGSAKNLADAGKLERSEVGNGEARVGAADIGDDGLSRQRVLSLHCIMPLSTERPLSRPLAPARNNAALPHLLLHRSAQLLSPDWAGRSCSL